MRVLALGHYALKPQGNRWDTTAARHLATLGY
jgi:hypothetical protein